MQGSVGVNQWLIDLEMATKFDLGNPPLECNALLGSVVMQGSSWATQKIICQEKICDIKFGQTTQTSRTTDQRVVHWWGQRLQKN